MTVDYSKPYIGNVLQRLGSEESKRRRLSCRYATILAFKALKPFVDRHLGDLQSITVEYRTKRGQIARGIRAEIIPKICDVWLDADEEVKRRPRQKRIAESKKNSWAVDSLFIPSYIIFRFAAFRYFTIEGRGGIQKGSCGSPLYVLGRSHDVFS